MQHVFPARSIARFVDAATGGVQLQRLPSAAIRSAKPRDVIFCAKRAWDARAERGYMKAIEDEFQELAERIIAGATSVIEPVDKGKIDRFFALWRLRAEHRDATSGAVQFQGITGEDLTRDQEEILESKGVFFVRRDGTMQGHRMRGIEIQIAIDRAAEGLSSMRWGVIRTLGRQLVVPDQPTIPLVPILPTLCLCGGETPWPPYAAITAANVIELNQRASSGAKAYVFANDLTECF